MKILLLGGNGQVGWQLRRSLAPVGDVVVAPSRGDGGPDMAQPDSLRAALRAAQPQLIVNAAAYTAVDRAEDEPDLAHAINATACEVIAAEAQKTGAWVVHYSSDYVYDGSGDRPHRITPAQAQRIRERIAAGHGDFTADVTVADAGAAT